MSQLKDRQMIELLGGEAGCRRIAKEFYARVATSAELKPLFPGKSLRCATEEFAAFLIQFLDGDQAQTQYRWWLSLRESHARFEITERQRAEWLGLMHQTLDSLIADAKTKRELKQFFVVSSGYILGKDQGEVEQREFNERWCQQRMLDQLIEHLANERDADAIFLALQFASRTSVFVGILARMMEAGRTPLVEFVLECDLADGRFNGRTLLHFAAGSGCLPVVQKLLANGEDPDVLDIGRHTALYRAATAEIVNELVKAGASVDHCGGVNRSTALNQAARIGNLAVAKALLKAGANPRAKDKNGFSPLDRARNCRRHEVAEFLSSH